MPGWQSHVLAPPELTSLPCFLIFCPADLGIYQGTPSALQFPQVKKGALPLKDPSAPTDPSKDRYLETSHAEPWFLRLVSATHYVAFVTQLTVALAYFQYALGQTALQPVAGLALPFLLVAGPLYQAMGGAGPNVMHEYEGFQVRLDEGSGRLLGHIMHDL
jgi:hypothetical protein